MAAAEVYDLDVFQAAVFGCGHGSGQHPGMEIVHDVQAALIQLLLFSRGKGVRRKHRDPKSRQKGRQVMVNEGIRLVGPCGQHYGIAALFLYLPKGPFSRLQKLLPKALLGFFRCQKGSVRLLLSDPVGILEEGFDLLLLLPLRVPEKERRVKLDPPLALRVVGIADHQGIAL